MSYKTKEQPQIQTGTWQNGIHHEFGNTTLTHSQAQEVFHQQSSMQAPQHALTTIFPASNQAAVQNTLIVQANVGFNTVVPGTLLNSTQYPSECTYDWNVSIPQLNNPGGPTPSVIAGMYNNVLLTLNGSLPASPGSFTGPGSLYTLHLHGIRPQPSRPNRFI